MKSAREFVDEVEDKVKERHPYLFDTRLGGQWSKSMLEIVEARDKEWKAFLDSVFFKVIKNSDGKKQRVFFNITAHESSIIISTLEEKGGKA